MAIQRLRFRVFQLCLIITASFIIFVAKTVWDIETPALSLHAMNANTERFQVLDRYGQPLSISYQNRFNRTNIIPLHEMPPLLQQAFITSEDRRFFEHHGVDWPARLSAILQNIHAKRAVRGASTITEQVVRIVHPRPRTLWSRWIEGCEAIILERHASKGEILEFYLNQVPYAANRRGVTQAARYYFNRDLDTLTHKEMLTLAVLPRAPSALDLYKNPTTIEPAIARLAQAMETFGELRAGEQEKIKRETLALDPPAATFSAAHFINYIRETIPYRLSENGILLTTLDGEIQQKAQTLLDERIKALARKRVTNGAVLVADHTTGEILAWAVGGAGGEDLKQQTPGNAIDAVRVPRQPGSSMKPFLYALALDSGWSPATELHDEPMAEAIGSGLHNFHNYSHMFYGKVSLREALGNSLNIPALQTIGFVTPEKYLRLLHRLGFASLTQPAEFYKDGLALGNGEVSLFEMVQAYSALANRGVFRPLTPLPQAPFIRESTRIYSAEAASLIAHILSDPYARRREFGAGSVLNFPVQTAVKTGTSSDYRDAWMFGFDSRYVVGVWLGNLDQTPMEGVTGSTGPALILRSMFADFAKNGSAHPLYISPRLVLRSVCTNYTANAGKKNCFPRTEYFIPGTEMDSKEQMDAPSGITLIRPSEGLQIAYDPRLPSDFQAFEFVANGIKTTSKVEWVLDGKRIAMTPDGHFLWPVERGHHTLSVREISDEEKIISSDLARFSVK